MSTSFTEQELKKFNKDTLIKLLLGQQDQLNELSQKMDILIEQITHSKQKRFGRSSEKVEVDLEQLSVFLNEAEYVKSNFFVPEPHIDEVVKPKPKKRVGKREDDLKHLPVTIVEHYLPETVLLETFPEGWKQLPDEIYKRLVYEPPKWKVEEHHVGVYAGKDNQTMVKGDRPKDLFRNSILTPSLAAAIINGKYVNALPLYRLEQEFLRQDIIIARQVMAHWMIELGERYFSLLYDCMRRKLLKCNVIQADETPVEVSKDGRKAGSKSYMWVYRTGKYYKAPAIVLYEYQKTRKTDHPLEFLTGYNGTLLTDGYQVYHKLGRENQAIKIAGCWAHARRPFADIVKALGEKGAKGSTASKAIAHIATIYHIDNRLTKSELTADEIKIQRQLLVKPQVDAFFEWAKQQAVELSKKGKTGKALAYCINQEPYLREFLNNGHLPLDNNATESTIRPFCIGKKNWKLMDTVNGAKSSAIIYSLVETAKANDLKLHEYFKYILEEMPKHMDDKDRSFIERLLPWSESLPEYCKKTIK